MKNMFLLSIVGEDGVPIQVDGEAWTQPPGIVRIVHKNRVQMLCRNRVSKARQAGCVSFHLPLY